MRVTKNRYVVETTTPSEYDGHCGVYFFKDHKMVMHCDYKKEPTKKELNEILKRFVAANSVYIIKSTNFDENNETLYLESLMFRNGWYKEFRNTDIRFTDSFNYALKIKSKRLAKELCNTCKQAIPNAAFKVVMVDISCIDNESK